MKKQVVTRWMNLQKQQLTGTLAALANDAPQEAATVVAEGRRLVVMNGKAMRHVDIEALLQLLTWSEAKHCQRG